MNADRWGQLTDSIRDFLDSGIRRILGGVTVDPITGYEYIFSQIREIFIMAVCGACMDFLFCVAAALIAARFWYISSCGRISFHEAAALIAGLLIGRSVFLFKNSKPVRALAVVYVIMLIIAYIVIS